ncbi:MAG: N-acetylmuramic acid 6-phosphate etherase [Bryobacteraceae bacterium]|nr:N-acetylmuramic acid 6-phosphate etherase [Bryobacteraceae bacterium]
MELERLLTERRNPASMSIDTMSTLDMLRVINEEDRRVAESITPELERIAMAVDTIAERLRHGGRLFYIGAGTSGRLGVLDASECPPTFNVPPDTVTGIMAGGMDALWKATEASEDDAEAGARDLDAHGFQSGDVLVGIAASGRTPYVLGAIRRARELGAATIGISCTPDSDLSRDVAIPIAPLPGPEAIAGSTRLKAGTATKLVLNMLSTGAMIKLGHVYSNWMVNVQPRNEKLLDRARRIVAEAAEVPLERATALLNETDGSVKTSIVMGKLGVGRAEAENRLRDAQGRVSEALKVPHERSS